MLMKFGWVEHEVIVVKQMETEAIPMWKLLVVIDLIRQCTYFKFSLSEFLRAWRTAIAPTFC